MISLRFLKCQSPARIVVNVFQNKESHFNLMFIDSSQQKFCMCNNVRRKKSKTHLSHFLLTNSLK